MMSRFVGHTISEQTRRKIAESNRGRIPDQSTRAKMGAAHKGRRHTDAWKAKMLALHSGSSRSDESRARMRLAALSRIFRDGGAPSIGKHENAILNNQEIVDGVTICRQVVTPVGFVVDGYCKETNTVYEVYEKHHLRSVKKDAERERAIVKSMGCAFVVIWDIDGQVHPRQQALVAFKNDEGETEYRRIA